MNTLSHIQRQPIARRDFFGDAQNDLLRAKTYRHSWQLACEVHASPALLRTLRFLMRAHAIAAVQAVRRCQCLIRAAA